MPADRKKKALLVVTLNNFFRGLWDVAEMMKRSGVYEPVFFFGWSYPTIRRDIAVCRATGIRYICPFEETPSDDLPQSIVERRPSTPHRPRVESFLKKNLPVFLQNRLRGFLRQKESIKNRLKNTLLNVVYSLIEHNDLVKVLLRHLSRFAPQLLLGVLRRNNSVVDYYISYFRSWMNTAHKLLEDNNICIVVLLGDNVGYDTGLFIKAAHEKNIPAVVVAMWMSGPLEPAEVYRFNPEFSLDRRGNRLVGAVYPRWVYTHMGHGMLRLPAEHAVVKEWMGFCPPLPWVWHSGYADVVAVESEAMKLHGVSLGLPSEQMVVTGNPTLDLMGAKLQNRVALRERLYQDLQLPLDKPMILTALPADFLYMKGGRPECEFETYFDLLRFWIGSLAGVHTHNLVISLHPSVKPEDMKHIEEWGGRITKETTQKIIPLCDIFVASISSTIQWAIACGKPAINYDVYKYRYDDYKDAAGVICMETREAFLEALRRLTEDPSFYSETARRQAMTAPRWGQLDGLGGERLLHVFDRLIADHQAIQGSLLIR